MPSDNEISAPSTPSGSVVSHASPCAADTSITTIGSVDGCSQDESSRRDSVTSGQGDNESEKHPKGKRKRTAAKDKAILEDAYRNNPKPDKWARLDIVERVSLNEKEVQIWFQNRRQNDRRKSRPLSPQEIAALRSGSMQILSTDPFYASYNNGVPTAVPVGPPSPGSHPVSTGHSISSISPLAPEQREHDMSFESQEDERSARGSFSSIAGGYTPHRWSVGSASAFSSFISEGSVSGPARVDPFGPSVSPTTVPAAHFKSQVRISLSLDGKAELVPQGELSPPRFPHSARSLSAAALPGLPLPAPGPRPNHGLQRSQSALSLPNITLPPISALTSSLSTSAAPSPSFAPPRLGRGRSRDAHAWELCADADAPDELTAQAENEANGSALAAISLLRSTNGVLQASQSKRNAVVGSKASSRPQGITKKPKFGRSSSSIARLQSLSTDDIVAYEKSESSKMKVSMLLTPPGDEDKENWSPDEDGVPRQPIQPRPRRPVPASSFLTKEHSEEERPTPLNDASARHLPNIFHSLDDNSNLMAPLLRRNSMPVSQRVLLGKRRSGDHGRLEIYEDGIDGSDVENHGRRVRRRSDEDIERFMKGEVSPSKKPDLDCITGLLSLSQGNWR